MSKDDLQLVLATIKNSVETSVKETVNGKINRLDEKLDNYIAADTKWKEEKVEPLIDAHRTIKNVANFLKWIAGVLAAIGLIIKGFFIEHLINLIK